jgi:hypothetical protein
MRHVTEFAPKQIRRKNEASSRHKQWKFVSHTTQRRRRCLARRKSENALNPIFLCTMVIPFPPDSSAPLVLLGQLRRFPLRLKQGADRGMDRKRPPARSLAWPVGLLVALCFTTLPLFLAMAPGRPALSGVWRKMGIRVTVSYDGTYARPSCTATILLTCRPIQIRSKGRKNRRNRRRAGTSSSAGCSRRTSTRTPA